MYKSAEKLFNNFIPRIIDNFKKLNIKLYDIHYERCSNGESFLAFKVKNNNANNSNNYIFYYCNKVSESSSCNVGFHADKSINKEAQIIINSDLTAEVVTFFENLEKYIDFHSTISFSFNNALPSKKTLFNNFKIIY